MDTNLMPRRITSAPLLSRSIAGVGSCPLVLGECVQGRLDDGVHFLITAPVDLYSRAEFSSDPSLTDLEVEPGHCTKALAAVLLYLELEDLPRRGRLRLHTGIKPGLGFGTSTGDITASLRAAASAWGRWISPELVSRIAVSIEPTDGTMYDGSVAYAHRQGGLLERLGPLPQFCALGVVTDEGVETVLFDSYRKDFFYSAADVERLKSAWRMVRAANLAGDVRLMAAAGSVSAEINQQLLPNPYFAELKGASRELGAEGCLVAHSGSLAALIFDPARPDIEKRREQASRFLEALGALALFEVENRDSRPVTAARNACRLQGAQDGHGRA